MQSTALKEWASGFYKEEGHLVMPQWAVTVVSTIELGTGNWESCQIFFVLSLADIGCILVSSSHIIHLIKLGY